MLEALIFLARVSLFAVFSIAGLGKLSDLKGEKKSLEGFGVPRRIVPILAVLLPTVELTIAFCLLFSSTAHFAAISALVLLLVFTAFLAYQLAKGNSADCHCFGSIKSEPISPKSLVRNFLFMIPAVFLIFQGENAQKPDFLTFSFEFSLALFFGLAVIALLGLICFYMKKIIENQTKILRQLEVLSFGEVGVERKVEEVKHPEEGLPVGAPVPSFAAVSIDGERISMEKIFSKGKSLLFVFISPSCGPCSALMPELLKWHEKLEDKVDFVLISNGRAAENKEKFSLPSGKILLQKDREISRLFGVQWTPTAVFVNKDGKIASKPIPGDTAIKSLLEKISLTQGEVDFIADENSKAEIKVGQKIPEFELPTASEAKISSKDFLGKKTLLTYWSPTCGFCSEMLEELKAWKKGKDADAPELFIISVSNDGAKEVEADFRVPVLIDERRELLQKLGMEGTPSAVLIDEQGRVVSEVAAGAQKIWALLGVKNLDGERREFSAR
ncbi:MAG: DoxX family membrane protein [Acidobacteria bacterium]|jgi:thioredoxin-related protein/uncharacterized membrane protein YphA (DoxX/SURF4 family)|nr:MAG: DoxX family membrane protein [Acidobacteriota bacterium]GIU82964.1 MAG: hypothetical protein KatS3mg006_2028 [Pyrinomonadaceae bacterium]